MVIWITGISGSGKTTIANNLIKKYKKTVNNLVNVDGDVVRELFGNDLKFDMKSRVAQIKRIQKMCLFLESQSLVVIASALYCDNTLMLWNRKNFKNYFEIYLDASLDLVRKRDIKGLYKKYDKGLEKNIVGLDVPWNEPQNFDLKINMDSLPTIERVINTINKKIDIESYKN